ncbi:HIT-like domain-containing protein [Alternaria rosae]|uniref:HIT-like domain-containing protein n=1 Tax=Alternaria rosae TaxID=1187941 RepID=UPI001E8CB9D3|nr:HIT-like domain-containing protein [Alternaria rosae]KAH6872468.1 HIT-like domain-containing protein [Alternaria rosae]
MFRAPSPACAGLRLLGASVLATTLRRHLRRHTGRMPLTKEVVKFGSFVVTNQVFHLTRLSFAIVNLKPLLPGHVLVSPRRVVPRFNDLSAAEVQDLFLTVQRVSRMVERVFSASSLNIAIQDGIDAGQSVPHVHTHIIPRKKDDLEEKGGTDAIYAMMESEDADLSKQLANNDRASRADIAEEEKKGRFPAVDNDSRKPRSDDEMQKEAEWLAEEMARDEQAAGTA